MGNKRSADNKAAIAGGAAVGQLGLAVTLMSSSLPIFWPLLVLTIGAIIAAVIAIYQFDFFEQRARWLSLLAGIAAAVVIGGAMAPALVEQYRRELVVAEQPPAMASPVAATPTPTPVPSSSEATASQAEVARLLTELSRQTAEKKPQGERPVAIPGLSPSYIPLHPARRQEVWLALKDLAPRLNQSGYLVWMVYPMDQPEPAQYLAALFADAGVRLGQPTAYMSPDIINEKPRILCSKASEALAKAVASALSPMVDVAVTATKREDEMDIALMIEGRLGYTPEGQVVPRAP